MAPKKKGQLHAYKARPSTSPKKPHQMKFISKKHYPRLQSQIIKAQDEDSEEEDEENGEDGEDEGDKEEEEDSMDQDEVGEFKPLPGDGDNLWDVIEIVGEYKDKYKIKWAGWNPDTGRKWADSWTLKMNVTNDLVPPWLRWRRSNGIPSGFKGIIEKNKWIQKRKMKARKDKTGSKLQGMSPRKRVGRPPKSTQSRVKRPPSSSPQPESPPPVTPQRRGKSSPSHPSCLSNDSTLIGKKAPPSPSKTKHEPFGSPSKPLVRRSPRTPTKGARSPTRSKPSFGGRR